MDDDIRRIKRYIPRQLWREVRALALKMGYKNIGEYLRDLIAWAVDCQWGCGCPWIQNENRHQEDEK
jgi:hypothetical protein